MKEIDLLVRYLLGNISETEQERLEREYFVNNDSWKSLDIVKNDLVDSYVRGVLPADQREQFEKHFLRSRENRMEVEFARLLLDPTLRRSLEENSVAGPHRQTESIRSVSRGFWNWRPRWTSLSAAAALVVIMAVLLLSVQNQSLLSRLRSEQSKQAVLQAEVTRLKEQLAKVTVPSIGEKSSNRVEEAQLQKGPVVSVLLRPGPIRGGGGSYQGSVLPISSVASAVVLRLVIERDDYSSYDALINDAGGKEVIHLRGLKAMPSDQIGPGVELLLPFNLFQEGDYFVYLSGNTRDTKPQMIHSYGFTASR